MLRKFALLPLGEEKITPCCLELCWAQAGESETADGKLKSQRKMRGDKKKRSIAVTKAILGEENLNG